MSTPLTGRQAIPPSQSQTLSLACSHCRAAPGQSCITPAGVNRHLHKVRLEDTRAAFRGRHMVHRQLKDDERFNLKSGDLLLTVNYPLDAKVTALARLGDGFDPECNRYYTDVEFIRWATDEDVAVLDGAEVR